MIKKILVFLVILFCEISEAKVVELTSDGGIKFWHYQDNSTPLVHLAVAFKNAGTSHMEPNKRAVPKLYVSTVFSGCGSYTKEQFQEKIRDISVRLNGFADSDNLFFFFTFPKIVREESVNLFKTVLLQPTFKLSEVGKSKNNISDMLENYNDSPIFWGATILFPHILFGNHPYGESLGSTEDLLKLTSDDLHGYRNKYIVKKNLELCVFGDVSEKEAKQLVDKIFGSLENGQKSEDKIENIEPKLNGEIKNYYLEGPQSFVIFAMRNVLKDSEKKYVATLLYHVLGSPKTFKNRVMNQLRSKEGLVYYGMVQKMEKIHTCWELGLLQTSNENVSKAINSIKKLIADIKKNGITESELNSAKSNLKGSFLVNLKTSADLCSFYISKKTEGYSPDILEEILRKIDAVTLEQVNNLAAEILEENKIPFVIFGSPR